jgi:hypothetical protein
VTLVRITVPSMDAEVVVEQPLAGIRIRVKGGDTASFEMDDTHPTTLRVIKPAEHYKPKALEPVPAAAKENWYQEAVHAHTLQEMYKRTPK